MLGNLTGWHFLILALVVLLLFGATKLPALARSVAQSTKIFRSEMKTDAPEAEADESAETTEKPKAAASTAVKTAKPKPAK